MRLSIRPPRWYHSSASPATTKGVAERNAEISGKGDATASSNADDETADDYGCQRSEPSEDRSRDCRYDHVGQRNNLQPHHVGQENPADAGEHAGNHPGPGIDAQDWNANKPADFAIIGQRTHRQAKAAEIEEQDHPDRDGQAQRKGDRPRGGDTHTEQFETQRVRRQPQAARPFAPNEFAEAENDQRKAKRRHRSHDRIAVASRGAMSRP